jgi:uncharacterized protein (DUF2141 family)
LALLRFTLFEIAPNFIPAGLLMVSSCADERPPSGGKRDSIPPKLKLAEPANKTLNFKSEKIKLHFSEFIQQTLDPKEIIISPPMDKKPKMMVDGKTVTITFKSKLKDSTTYTINFGDAIKDINEGNILKNFTYVFATGPVLDTASISGTVSNIAEPGSVDNLIITLHPADSVDGIKHSRPFYFAKSDKNGAFTINNIHSGTYNVFALKDQNLNYMYDQSDELIGFLDSTVRVVDSSKAKVSLSVFLSVNNRPKFTDAMSVSPGKIIISYNAPIKNIKLNSDLLSNKDIVEISDRKDSIIYWYSSIYDKKMHLSLVVNDTISDSTTLDLKTYNKDSINNNIKYALSIESQSFKSDSTGKKTYIKTILSPFKPIILNLSRPVDSLDKNKSLVITKDSSSKKDTVAYVLSLKTKRKISIDYPQVERSSYTLIIPDSTFLDIFGWWNKKLTYKWTSDASENYGNIILNLKIEHPEKHYVLKILDQDNKAVETLYYHGQETKTETFKNIKAGLYHLQAVDDTNNNGEWDTGDFSKKLQPEKIINFHETYEVKGNWDLEIEVKL